MMSVLKRVHRMLDQRSDARFLSTLNPSQQTEVGISATDLGSLTSGPADTRARMEAMAAAHGLVQEDLGREHWREVDMARACGHCGQRRVCAKWLAGKRQDLSVSDFCPNAAHFADLKQSPDRGSAP